MKKIIFVFVGFFSLFLIFSLKGNAYSKNDMYTYFDQSIRGLPPKEEGEFVNSFNQSTEYIGTSPYSIVPNSVYDSVHSRWTISLNSNRDSFTADFSKLVYGFDNKIMPNRVYFALTLSVGLPFYLSSIGISYRTSTGANYSFSKDNAGLSADITIYFPLNYSVRSGDTELSALVNSATFSFTTTTSVVFELSIVSLFSDSSDRASSDYGYILYNDSNAFTYPRFFNVPAYGEEQYNRGYKAGYDKGFLDGRKISLEGKNSFSNSVVNIFNNSPSTGKWYEGKVLSQSLNVSNSIDFTKYYNLNSTLESGANLSTLFVQFSTGFYIYPRDISFTWNRKDFSPENVVLKFYSGDILTLSLGSAYVPFDSKTKTFTFQLEDTRQLSRLDTVSISFYKVNNLNAAQYPLSMKVVASQFSLGYQAGYEESDKLHKNEYDKGLNAGYDKGFQEGYESGHDVGYNEGSTDSLNKTGLPGFFSLILQYPIDFFKSIFNFEIMGINIFGLITFILSVGLAVYVWRRFK